MLIKKCFFLCAIAVVLFGCGGPLTSDVETAKMERALAKAGSGPFNGIWNVRLTGTKDTCGYGLKGQSFNTGISVLQRGSKVNLTLTALGKTFKGVASGKVLNASGSYRNSSGSFSGKVQAKLSRTNLLSVSRANLNISVGKKRCYATFSGAGTK